MYVYITTRVTCSPVSKTSRARSAFPPRFSASPARSHPLNLQGVVKVVVKLMFKTGGQSRQILGVPQERGCPFPGDGGVGASVSVR